MGLSMSRFSLVDSMPDAKPYRIVEDDYVTLTDGSGIVHIALHSVRTTREWTETTICPSYSL